MAEIEKCPRCGMPTGICPATWPNQENDAAWIEAFKVCALNRIASALENRP